MTYPSEASFLDNAWIHSKPDSSYACFHVEGTHTRLSRDDAHKLWQWLTDWLGDEPQPGYTDEDVEQLVEAAKEWRKKWTGSNYHLEEQSQHLYDAISPFLTLSDPDAELVEKMIQADSASAYTNSAVDTMRAILAVVRAHDKEQAK